MRPYKRKIRAQLGKRVDTTVPTSSTVATVPPDEALPSQYGYGNIGDIHIPELPNPQQWHGADTMGGDEFNQGILPQDNLSTTETTTQAPKGNAYENVFRGLRGSSILGSFLASKKRNTLLRQYEYKQQSALGQMNPMPVSQFQYGQNDYTTPNRMYAQEGGMMNPYSYYAKNGGNLPQIIKDYNKWSNDAKEMDMTSGYGPEGKPQRAKGGFAFDEVKVRDIITRLMQVGSGPHPYRKKKGGKMTPNDARQILHDGTAQGHPLTDKQRRYFGALSKGNTLHFPQKKEGGTIKHIDMELKKGGWLRGNIGKRNNKK